jgi:hypothetical protein
VRLRFRRPTAKSRRDQQVQNPLIGPEPVVPAFGTPPIVDANADACGSNKSSQCRRLDK